MTAALDQQRFVAPAEHVAEQLVSVIEPEGVGAQEPTHPRHQVRLGRFHHQMKVVAHQAIGMHLESCLLTGLGQRLEKVLPIDVITKDILPPIPTAHDVVDRHRKLHSQLAWHWSRACPIHLTG